VSYDSDSLYVATHYSALSTTGGHNSSIVGQRQKCQSRYAVLAELTANTELQNMRQLHRGGTASHLAVDDKLVHCVIAGSSMHSCAGWAMKG
jgi:hypothetical protein